MRIKDTTGNVVRSNGNAYGSGSPLGLGFGYGYGAGYSDGDNTHGIADGDGLIHNGYCEGGGYARHNNEL